jgi:hypothetical protein
LKGPARSGALLLATSSPRWSGRRGEKMFQFVAEAMIPNLLLNIADFRISFRLDRRRKNRDPFFDVGADADEGANSFGVPSRRKQADPDSGFSERRHIGVIDARASRPDR